jgi:hypothetical protein
MRLPCRRRTDDQPWFLHSPGWGLLIQALHLNSLAPHSPDLPLHPHPPPPPVPLRSATQA